MVDFRKLMRKNDMAFGTKAKPKTESKPAPKSGGFEDQPNTGVLFENDKGDNENRPDYTGRIIINPDTFEPGPDGLIRVRVAVWNRVGKTSGTPYQYLKIEPEQQK